MVAADSALPGHNGLVDILQPCGSSGHVDLSGDKAQAGHQQTSWILALPGEHCPIAGIWGEACQTMGSIPSMGLGKMSTEPFSLLMLP